MHEVGQRELRDEARLGERTGWVVERGVDHLEELRQRVLRSLLAVVVGAGLCLVAVKPLVRMLEAAEADSPTAPLREVFDGWRGLQAEPQQCDAHLDEAQPQ